MATAFGKPLICPALIGRAASLEALQQFIHQASLSHGQTILIAGEAGLGKSRLVAEARAYASMQNFLLLEGQCFPTDIASPYAPLTDLLRAYFTSTPPTALDERLQAIGRELTHLLPGIAPLATHESMLRRLEPEQTRRQVITALTEFFTLQAAERPVLVVVEDLHWADDASLDFLLHLTRQCANRPLLALFTYRNDESRPGLPWLAQMDRERVAAELTLTRLTYDEVGDMIRAIFAQKQPIRREFLDAIYPLTDGNPFFVEELLTSLVATGSIFSTDQGWDRKPLHELSVPRSIQGAVQQRSALLSDARQLLTLAAVAGRRFDFALLHALTQFDEPAFLVLIKELVACRLVVEESPDQFAFRHALTRQAIYSELLVRERQALHHQIAKTIERQHADSLDPHTADLAYHFYEAGAWEQALTYGRRAGILAQSLYAPRAVVEHVTRALHAARHLVHTPPADLYRMRGQAHETLGDFEQANADLDAALQVAQGVDRFTEWQTLLDLGKLWASRDYARAGGYLRRALDLARELGDPTTLAHSLNRIGNWHLNIEQPIEARDSHAEALAIFERTGDARGVAETHDLLGMACYLGGDLIAGTAHFARAVEGFLALDDRQGLASSLATLTMRGGAYQTSTMVAAANLDEAAREGEEALAVAQRIGWRAGEAYALIFLSFCLGARGAYDRAMACAYAGLTIAEEIEHRQWMTAARCALGALHLDLLDLREARECLEQALALARAIGSSHWILCATGYLASAYVLLDEQSQARAVLDAVLDKSTPAQTLGRRLAWCAHAELALAGDDAALALQVVNRLVAHTANITPDGLGAIPRLARLRAEALLALATHQNRGDQADAAEVLIQAALQTADAQLAQPMIWRLQVALGNVYRHLGRHDEAEQACAAARSIIEALAADLSEPQLRESFLRRATAMLPATRHQKQRRVTQRSAGGLTAREREVAIHVGYGKTNQEIAEALVLSERTVETHISHILSKLSFDSRAQIAEWAAQNGLLSEGR